LGAHAVELLGEQVLDVDFVEGDDFALARGAGEEVGADEEVDVADEAGVEEVGELDDEAEEGAEVDGRFAREAVFAESGVVADYLGQRLGVLLHLAVLLCNLPYLGLVGGKLACLLPLHVYIFYMDGVITERGGVWGNNYVSICRLLRIVLTRDKIFRNGFLLEQYYSKK
jgi:hypothetical protein